MDSKVIVGRLVPYWFTVLSSLWILAFLYLWTSTPGWELYNNNMVLPLVNGLSTTVVDWGSNLVGFMGTTVLATCLCALLLTDHTLPNSRVSWANKSFALLRSHETPFWVRAGRTTKALFRRQTDDADYGHEIAHKKVNQFARGDANMNFMAIWLIFIPNIIGFFAYLPSSIKSAGEYAVEEGVTVEQLRWEYTSYLAGWASIMCLVWFMIPVTRHSILVAAMGWNPTAALRIHIWAGYLSFAYMILHGVILVAVWYIYYDYPVWQQVIPAQECWTMTWTEETLAEMNPPCDHVFYNLTGLVAAVPFIILWGSSFNWVRRRHYRLFYILHVVCGTLTILTTILHMQFFALYFIPSITYYMASTAPTLIQALASRFRGGVKIVQVVAIENSGGCVEVHFDAHAQAHVELDKEPCLHVKLCVPKISLVWHPFDVFKHPDDPATVRFLFRPVGPFTKQLAERLTSPERPVTLVDGFYKGADRSEQALQHDCVTIVAGGVAIAPYLSMIPALLRRIGRAADGIGTHTTCIALHWVCRDAGLCSFVLNGYLRRILDDAKRTHGNALEVECHVYLTGADKTAYGSDASDPTLENSSRMLYESFANNHSKTSPTHSETSPNQSETSSEGDLEAPDKKRQNEEQLEADANIITKDECNSVCFEGECLGGSPPISDGAAKGGHVLEVARLMPRRYSNPVWNVPAFFAISGLTWFGFWYIFKHYTYPYSSYYDLSKETWINMYFILIAFAFGIGVEGVVLAFRNVWPQPRLDSFDVVRRSVDAKGVVLDGDCDTGVITAVSSGAAAIVFHEGRPTADQLLASARLATAPGIFMCGPATLLGMLKKETSKENSLLGLTRFCLYEEHSEM